MHKKDIVSVRLSGVIPFLLQISLLMLYFCNSIPGRGVFYLLQSVHTGPGARSAFNSQGIGESYSRGKADEV